MIHLEGGKLKEHKFLLRIGGVEKACELLGWYLKCPVCTRRGGSVSLWGMEWDCMTGFRANHAGELQKHHIIPHRAFKSRLHMALVRKYLMNWLDRDQNSILQFEEDYLNYVMLCDKHHRSIESEIDNNPEKYYEDTAKELIVCSVGAVFMRHEYWKDKDTKQWTLTVPLGK